MRKSMQPERSKKISAAIMQRAKKFCKNLSSTDSLHLYTYAHILVHLTHKSNSWLIATITLLIDNR